MHSQLSLLNLNFGPGSPRPAAESKDRYHIIDSRSHPAGTLRLQSLQGWVQVTVQVTECPRPLVPYTYVIMMTIWLRLSLVRLITSTRLKIIINKRLGIFELRKFRSLRIPWLGLIELCSDV